MATGKIIQGANTLMPLPKVTEQAAEPTPPAAGSFEVWEQTTDSNRSYLLYRRQDSTIRRLELLSSIPAFGIPTLPVTCTTGDITLYVKATGSDSNDGLTVPTALLTIQAAVDKIPKLIKHKVVIEVGAGNFGAFRVSGFSLSTWVGDGADYQFTIRGAAFIAWTPATGLGSGTSTGGTTNTLIDAGGGWTVNNLRGKWVYVNSEWLIIRSNDATSFETIGISASTMSGKAYVIQDHSTFINTKVTYANMGIPPGGSALSACIWLDNNSGNRVNNVHGVHITRLQINAPASTSYGVSSIVAESAFSYLSVVGTSTIGLNISNSNCIYAKHIYTLNNTSTCFSCSAILNFIGSNIFCYNGAGRGCTMQYNTSSILTYVYADYCGTYGIRLVYCGSYAAVTSSYATFCGGPGFYAVGCSYLAYTTITSSSNKYGLTCSLDSPITTNSYQYAALSVILLGTNVLSNNTDQGIVLGANATLRCTTLTGTGNGGYGIYAKLGAKAFITSATTITGTLGDVMVGGVVNSYVADFATDKDYVLDVSQGTLVQRSDTIVF